MEKRFFTSECVTNGHPDKVADSISDAILDACLAQDPGSRVACETMVTTDFCLICGEITTKAKVDYDAVAREAIRAIGYTREGDGFNADTVEIQCRIHTQSADIALGTNDEVGGAGDQGMMFGGACTQTPELMPLPAALSRALCNRLTECVHENDLLRPDGKTQVTVEFDEDGKVVGVDTVVVSIMHSADFQMDALRAYIRENVIAPVLAKYGFDVNTVPNIFINPTGHFVIGGPNGDTGLTGRKIIVDTYGGYFSHGGGAFSGKDPTKVDRSAAYMARYMAKNLVAAGLAEQVQVQLAYAIGVAEPVSVRVDSYGTGKVSDETMTELLLIIYLIIMNQILMIAKWQQVKLSLLMEPSMNGLMAHLTMISILILITGRFGQRRIQRQMKLNTLLLIPMLNLQIGDLAAKKKLLNF